MMPSPAWERFDPKAAIGRWVHGFTEVTSTMDVAWELADAGAPHGTAATAESQTKGRGRFGRPWLSAPGDSLLVSVVLRPPPEVARLVSVMASLAVREAARDLAGLTCTVKWPNDVRARGRKLAGILAEARATTGGETTVVLGVGLNLNLDASRHAELRDKATSLFVETGRRYAVMDALVALLASLERWYSLAARGGDLVGEWRRHLDTLGRRVTVRQRDGVITGVAEDVDGTGRLLVRTDNGQRHALAEGDVTLAP